MPGLKIRVKRTRSSQDTALVELDGSFDQTTVPTFKKAIDQIKGRGIRSAVLDMSQIIYVNSSGLAALVKFSTAITSSGGTIVCINATPRVSRLIDMLGLNGFFPMAGNLKAALEHMGLSDSSVSGPESSILGESGIISSHKSSGSIRAEPPPPA